MNIMTAKSTIMLVCVIMLAASAGEMRDVYTVRNNYSAKSGTPVNPPKITYVTNGKPLQGWVFTQKTGSTDVMSVSTDNGASYLTPAKTAGGTGTYEGGGDTIVFNKTPTAGLPVVLKMRTTNTDWHIDSTFYNNTVAFDGWIRLKTLGFPGYESGNTHIGDGVWLGWADNVLNGQRPKDNAAYEWDDLVFILQGVTPLYTDPDGNTVPLNLIATYSKNRLVVASWKEENTY